MDIKHSTLKLHTVYDNGACTINETLLYLIGGIMYQYFIKVVPTLYRRLNNETMGTNQFAVTKHQRPVRSASGEHGLPGQ